MSPEWFLKIVLQDKLEFKERFWITHLKKNNLSWSFDEEWKHYVETHQQKTWDMTASERLNNFFSETKTTQSEIAGKLVLDAGCGNGQLTKAIAEIGANVVGIDRQPHLPESNSNTQFVQGDFDDNIFVPGSFDIIIANGSIHHTKNTFHSFKNLAELTKEGGRLYVWVYKKQKGWKRFLLWWLDMFRFFISRYPLLMQKLSVNILTQFFYMLSRIRKGENSNRSKNEIKINVYDAFTPRYRHYQTENQVREWFYQCGFKEAFVTHDNNKYGFGMLGIKKTEAIV